jgi:hypothetical protein
MASNVNLPRDRNSEPVQVLSLDFANAVYGALAVASARVTIPTMSDIIQIVNTQDMWIKFGDGTVTAAADTAGNVLLLAGERVYRVPAGMTHMAFIRDSADGRVGVVALV